MASPPKIPALTKTRKAESISFIVETITFELVYTKLAQHITLFEGVKPIHHGRFLDSPKGHQSKDKLQAELMRVMKAYIRSCKS